MSSRRRRHCGQGARRGYFNIHGESPLGGHLRIARCAAIYFIVRPFFGRRSCSLQFVNTDGGAMFEVFVGRDEKRELLADQLVRFSGCAARDDRILTARSVSE